MIFRKCLGNVHAMLLLNRANFTALDRLLDAYLATTTDDPDLGRLRNIRDGFQPPSKNVIGIDFRDQR